jgi:hypothetical protein
MKEPVLFPVYKGENIPLWKAEPFERQLEKTSSYNRILEPKRTDMRIYTLKFLVFL